MIHHQPPRLTLQQAQEARRYRMGDLGTFLVSCVPPETAEAARREARHLLRDTIGKAWEAGDARLAKAAAFGDALYDMVARDWHKVTVDARDALVACLMAQRLGRYLTLYGGRKIRAMQRDIRREMLASSN